MILFQFEQFTSVLSSAGLLPFLAWNHVHAITCKQSLSGCKCRYQVWFTFKSRWRQKKSKERPKSLNPDLLTSLTRGCVRFPSAFPLRVEWKTQLEPAEARQGHTSSDLPQPPSAVLHLHLGWPWMRVTLFMLMRQVKHPFWTGHVTVHHPKPHLGSGGGGSGSSYLYCYGATLLTFTSTVLEAGVRMIPPSFLNQIKLFYILRIEEPTFRPTLNNFIWIKRWMRKMWALSPNITE